MHSSGISPTRQRSLLLRASAVFFAGGLAAYFYAPSEAPRDVAARKAALAVAHAPQTSERVAELLAQGGCPGWMALASDPALQSSIDHPVVGASYGSAETRSGASLPMPRVQYPVPLRAPAATTSDVIALPTSAPTLIAAASSAVGNPAAALLPASSADDELISEDDDLLFSSPEIAGAKPPGDAAAPAVESLQDQNSADEPAPGPAPPAELAPPEESPPAESPPPEASPPAGDGASADDLLEDGQDLLAPGIGASGSTGTSETPEPLPAPPTPSGDDLLHDQNDLLDPQRPRPEPLRPPAPQPTLPPRPAVPQAPATNPAPAPAAAPWTAAGKAPADAASRCEFVAKSLYPSASECRTCHEKIYEEWSVSSHAYAFVSPMFHKFEQKINDITSGTIGYFCYRCHTPVGTSLGLSRAAPLWEAPLPAREGVTCVACHRVREMYGKTNGERRIEPGSIFEPVYGTIGGDGVAIAAGQKSHYKVHTSPGEKTPGVDMHAMGVLFPQLGRSEFCTSCHQVAVYPGIKLEVVWEQYRASPACKKGIQCQDCHMGRIPGVASDYEYGPAALINKKDVHPHRKHSNHVFYGPGYSIAHPGIFPFNPKAERWTVRDWLQFDWRAGWGTDEFEDAVEDGKVSATFPDVWKESDDRCDAREILEDNLKKKGVKNWLRAQVMENGSHVDGPFFDGTPGVGQELKFSYVVINTNEGHNLPTASLGAQPQLWANVVLIGPRGQRLWESGYLDSNGDLSDIHSVDVRNKQLEFDWQLFNLQTMFLITGAKGTDREFFLPVNIDIDPLPFIRPAAQPISVLNHPPFIRMEARSLAPLGSRRVPYKIPGQLLCEPGRYRLSFRMRNRTEPLYFMRFCESTVEMQRAMIEGTLDFHESSVEFDVR